MKIVAGVVIALLALGGLYLFLRGDPLLAELNKHWPAVNLDQQRQAAVDSTASALLALTAPNVAAGVDADTIKKLAFENVKSWGVSKLEVATDRQLLHLTADFNVTLKPDDLPPGSDKRPLVEKWKPQIAGHINLFLGAAATLTSGPQRAIQVRLLPSLREVKIDKATIEGSVDASAAGEVIAFLLNRYADNLASAVSEKPLLDLTLPPMLQEGIDPSAVIKPDIKDSPDLKIVVTGNHIKSPLGLGPAAWLIDGDRLVALIQLTPIDKPLSNPGSASGKFEEVRAAIMKSLSAGLDIPSAPAGVWIALGKELVAQTLDSVFAQAQPCLDASGSMADSFQKKIPIPNGSQMNCMPEKECRQDQRCDTQHDDRDCRRARDCPHNHDTRECKKCALGVCVNDPVCEGAKATQNAAYDASYSACVALGPVIDGVCEAAKAGQNKLYEAQRLQCEAEKEGRRQLCEVEKTAKKAGCEAVKQAEKTVSQTGNFANVSGDISGPGEIKVCFQDVHFADSMNSLALNMTASGSGSVKAAFKFVPLDAGHVLCPFEWTADKTISVSIPAQSIPIRVSLARRPSPDKIIYEATLDETSVSLHFNPSPLSLILQNINFALACPIPAGIINGITLNLAPAIPEVLKDYRYNQKSISFPFTVGFPDKPLLGHTIKPEFAETSRAIMLSGSLQ
ncbi:hypothetical protein [Mesorhizobium silamurunense]|uniref:hypothetical protein n=1 Tax=Mesorhizobium silamurunense TaxID=499528 RepID=UPI001781827F|nr:hypothetical protein [Mesorhizobium silamurunense]